MKKNSGISTQRGVDLLTRQLNRTKSLTLKIKDLRYKESDVKRNFDLWQDTTREYIQALFGSNAPQVRNFTSATLEVSIGSFFNRRSAPDALGRQANLLRTYIELLKEPSASEKAAGTGDGPRKRARRSRHNDKTVFVVHGHDDALRAQVSRLLERLNLNAVVLQEQPNLGRTTIEKFEQNADGTEFAVILLTGDDFGGEREGKSQPRARQNVILELGYFMGKLGRKRVCALYEEGVELPSDYHGILYLKYDANGAWKTNLAKELKAAGLPVDMNKL